MRFHRLLNRAFVPFFAAIIGLLSSLSAVLAADGPALDYRIELKTAHKGYDGKRCWVHARAGAIPPKTAGNLSERPVVVMTTQQLLVTGSDVFYGLHDLRTDDLAKTWAGPQPHKELSRRPFAEGGEINVCDFWPQWHARSGKLLGTGHTVRYIDNAVHADKNPRWTAYSVYDPKGRTWSAWKTLALPRHALLDSSGAGCTQRHDLPNGDLLLPVYCNPLREGRPLPETSMVLRCRFDGTTLRYVEHGNGLTYPTGRGYGEPSLAKFGDWFYLTLRNDDFAAVARRGQDFARP